MGNYERTLEMIKYYEDVVMELRAQLIECESDEDRSDLYESIADYEQSIGECRGYLEELASMDGYRSYEEMMYDCCGWTY